MFCFLVCFWYSQGHAGMCELVGFALAVIDNAQQANKNKTKHTCNKQQTKNNNRKKTNKTKATQIQKSTCNSKHKAKFDYITVYIF